MRKYLIIVAAILAIGFSITVRGQESNSRISSTAEAACEEYGEVYGIQPELIEAIIEVESGGINTQPTVDAWD